MAETWAISGVDLHLDLAGSRVGAALEHGLREAVQSGRLHPGARLPSSRALASDLGIARNTVAGAYTQLVAEGWLTARQGSGTRVTGRPASPNARPVPTTPAADVTARYDLRPGWPDLSAFPRSEWLAATRRAVGAAPAAAFGYPYPAGRPELRHALAGYLSRARGVHVTPGRVVVCAGFTHGLAALCQVLRARGTAVLAVESYGHPAHRDIAAAAGLRLAPLPVDAGGAAIFGPNGAGAVLLTPAHQFPLGMPLPPQRRTQAAEWAVQTGGLIIEDDYDGEFRYDRQPVGAMQALAPEHAAYAGTASKTLAPGLRLGWLVLPAHLVADVAAASTLADRPASSLDQLALAEFITSGSYDRHVRRCRLAYRRRRDLLIAALRRQVPQARVLGTAAGLHALVELPPGQREDQVITRAAQRGLAIEGLSAYSAVPSRRPPSLVIGYATPPGHAFTGSLARLCAALAGE